MGIAAYNRGTRDLSRQIDRKQRPVEFLMMDHLNSLPKYEDCGKIKHCLIFTWSPNHRVWWVEIAGKDGGFGYVYTTLREAVRRWNVSIVEFANGVWTANPIS